jgi:hypothetical protein
MTRFPSWYCAVLLAACFAPLGACDTTLVNPQVPPPGSESYRDGYLNGCSSGFADAGRDGYQTDYYKDESRYANEPDYRKGWNEGHVACYEEDIRHPKRVGF